MKKNVHGSTTLILIYKTKRIFPNYFIAGSGKFFEIRHNYNSAFVLRKKTNSNQNTATGCLSTSCRAARQ